jgi:hypothetical protein
MQTIHNSVITVTTAGTRQQCAAIDGHKIFTTIVFQGDPDNTDIVVFGGSGVTAANGGALQAGQFGGFGGDQRRDGTDEFNITDFWVDAAVSGEKIRILAISKR